ncbi:hypothetical protein Tco_0510270, partial [Tanacetum coccineum]
REDLSRAGPASGIRGKTTLASASQDKQAAGVGLVLWGDLKVLIDD